MAERSARAIRVLWPAGFVLGVVAERAAFAWSDVGRWVPDLVAGWALIACGLLAWRRRPESRSGALMTATGFAWFAGNFTPAAVYLHRGPLVQLVLTYPDGRLRGRLQPVAVGIGYVTAAVEPVWRNETTALVLAALLVIVAAHDYLGAVGRERRAKWYALEAAIFIAVVLAGTTIVRLAAPTPTATTATLLSYDAAVCALALGLFVGLIREPWARTHVTDLVVDLGERREDSLRAALARALGDTRLEVAYRLPDSGEYVDAAGRPVVLSTSGPTRRITYVERDGQIVAALVHDPAILEDPELSEAVAAAARLGATNARLQAEVRSQVTELQASRRRLLLAADDERRRLEERLRQGAERRLSTVAPVLANADAHAVTDQDTTERLQRAREQLGRTIDELRELAAGLHPRELAAGGFTGALASLAERAPVPVELSVTDERLPTDLQTASYFICSEALANIAKYSGASRASITVTAVDGRLRVEIADDGVGGADSTRGSGLSGLADRVHALGGTFSVASPIGAGTRLLAEFPLGEPAP